MNNYYRAQILSLKMSYHHKNKKEDVIRLLRWESKYTGEVDFTYICTQLNHPHYRCMNVINSSGQKKMLWKLHAAASPFMPLYDIYRLFALPTRQPITASLLHFIAKGLKSYRNFNAIEHFELEFFSINLSSYKHSPLTHPQIASIVKRLKSLTEQQQKKFLQEQINKIGREDPILQDYDFLQKQTEANLNQLLIIPQGEKMKRLKQICQKMESFFKMELMVDKKTAHVYLLTDSIKTDENQIMTLQHFLQLAKKDQRLGASEQIIESFSCSLLKQIVSINKMLDKSKWSLKFPLNFDNVFVEIALNEQKQPKNWNLLPDCRLDIMQPLLATLGLHSSLSTIQNILVFRPPVRPYAFPFQFEQVLKQDFKIQQDNVVQIETTIKWILLIDHLRISLSRNGKQSIIQVQPSRRKVLNNLIESKDQIFHSTTTTLVNLLKMDCSQETTSILSSFTLSKMEELYEQDDKAGDFQSLRYSLVKNSLQLRQKMFFEEEGLKNFCLKNKFIKCFDKYAKLALLQLITFYAILQMERQLLELWRGEKVDLTDPKSQLSVVLTKFTSFLSKLQIEMEKGKKTDTQIDKNAKKAIEISKNLRKRPIGFDTTIKFPDKQLKLTQVKELIGQGREQIEIMFDLIKEALKNDVQRSSERNSNRDASIYLSALKALRLLDLYVHLTFNNYPQVIQQQDRITSFKPTNLKTMTKDQVKKKFIPPEHDPMAIIKKKQTQSLEQLLTELSSLSLKKSDPHE